MVNWFLRHRSNIVKGFRAVPRPLVNFRANTGSGIAEIKPLVTLPYQC